MANAEIEIPDRAERAWRRAVLSLLAACGGALALFFVLLIAIDPYDSGRFPTFMPAGSPDERPATIDISRGRDPRFNAALLGSSRGVLADPRRISALTGFRFVEMATEGGTPREQMAQLHWFAHHHPRVEALVIAVDQAWCSRDPALPGEVNFPYGLYADGDFAYLKASFNLATLAYAAQRIRYALGLVPGVDPAGYFDMEAKQDWSGADWSAPEWHATAAQPAPISLPSLELLAAHLADVPAHVPMVVWMPPYYRNVLPPPGTAEGLALQECKMALRGWAARRPNTVFLDLATDTPEVADRANFLSQTHVSNRFMRLIEPRIATALNQAK
jgi:hypothetical protein